MKIFKSDKVIYSFKHEMPAIAIVRDGETFSVKTNDCFFQQIVSEDQGLEEVDYDKLNPATGPFFVENAEKGDVLKVEILDIQVENQGVAITAPNEGLLADQSKKATTRIIPIEEGFAVFQTVKIPIDPMIGVIGVAPGKSDGECPTSTPWSHGGNMDTTDNRAGSILYFPIRQDGALLALGDCHAAMGDGEICFTGLETPAMVTLKVSVIKQKKLDWPLVETPEATMIIVSGDTVDQALYNAASEAVQLMQMRLGISWEDAYIMSSLTTDLKISQVVDPKVTVRASIPKYVIETNDLFEAL